MSDENDLDIEDRAFLQLLQDLQSSGIQAIQTQQMSETSSSKKTEIQTLLNTLSASVSATENGPSEEPSGAEPAKGPELIEESEPVKRPDTNRVSANSGVSSGENKSSAK
jgi:hypothetical protein